MELNENQQLTIENYFSLRRSLSCVALHPGLRSILLFDISPSVLQKVATTMASLLQEVSGGKKVVPVKLGSYESEDNLWGEMGVGGESEQQDFTWRWGLLCPQENSQEIPLVIIPDLTKLSLAAVRACVILMGADVAHLERHQQQQSWQPNLCWLAGCSSKEEEIGKVSPHLLDRFALRLNGKIEDDLDNQDKVSRIVELLNKQQLDPEDVSFLGLKEREIGSELKQQLQKAVQHTPEITGEALARILDYTPSTSHGSESEVYHRREIALARFSFANAQLEGAKAVTVTHVNLAARMMGLKLLHLNETEDENYRDEQEEQKEGSTSDSEPRESATSESTEFQSSNSSENKSKQEKSLSRDNQQPVYKSHEPESSSEMRLKDIPSLENNPYPEDKAPVEREMASLKLPTPRFLSKAIARGTIIGVEKATTVEDLAIVRTLLEAAKFQPIRKSKGENGENRDNNLQEGLKICWEDLYRYRRAPVAEQMLMLLLDYTCLEHCQWQEELFPYLSWAYAERATVGLIQVGVAKDKSQFKNNGENPTKINPQELKAEKILAQTILVPSISNSLDDELTKKGRATPLAHGLDLTLKTLRHALQHGRNSIQKAVLVIISDGRGNVPLEASHLGKINSSVGSKGVEDALAIAEKIGNLDNVEAMLLNPQSKYYPELPLKLAKALGAKVRSIPVLEIWEIEE